MVFSFGGDSPDAAWAFTEGATLAIEYSIEIQILWEGSSYESATRKQQKLGLTQSFWRKEGWMYKTIYQLKIQMRGQ